MKSPESADRIGSMREQVNALSLVRPLPTRQGPTPTAVAGVCLIGLKEIAYAWASVDFLPGGVDLAILHSS